MRDIFIGIVVSLLLGTFLTFLVINWAMHCESWSHKDECLTPYQIVEAIKK